MGFANINNTNFENGISNRSSGHIFGSMIQPDPTRFIYFHDDFVAPGVPSTADNTMQGYTDTPASTVIEEVASFIGGAVTLDTTASAGVDCIIQTRSQGFNFQPGARMYFATRLQLDDVTNTLLVAGLSAVTADVTPADGIVFTSNDVAETLNISVFSTAGGLLATETNIATIFDGIAFSCEFYFDGIDRVYFSVNQANLGFLDLSGVTLPLNITGLAPTVGPISGATAQVETASVDYLFAARER